jgi:hypothetical protein
MDGLQEGIEAEMNAAEVAEAPKVETPIVETPKELSTDNQQVVDNAPDVEYDINGEKVKYSQIKAWKEGHVRQEEFSKKMNEYTEERERISPVLEFMGLLNKSPDRVNEFLNWVESVEKGQPYQATKQMPNVGNVNPNELLKNLDMSKPENQLIAAQLEQLKQMQEKFSGYEAREQAAQQEVFKGQATNLIKTSLDEVKKGLKFSSDHEEGLWRDLLLGALNTSPSKYKDEADFKSYVGEIGKKIFERVNNVGEKRIADNLRAKAKPSPQASSQDVGNKEPIKKELYDEIEDALKNGD